MKKNNLTYATISIDDLPKVNFKEVNQTSADTIRRSLDLTEFLLSWVNTPSFIENELIIPIGIYNHKEILEILKGEKWQNNEVENEL
tara:strand:- start:1512 stop:1772 length:261 start_codon:yes stop_codon:yes gene_type:complete